MPGSSLWLVPPADAPISDVLNSLIAYTIPPHFSHLTPARFSAHVTLTSDIDPKVYGDRPQQWLDQEIQCPSGTDLLIAFEALDTEPLFFRKLTIRVEKHTVLAELAKNCRAAGVTGHAAIPQRWVDQEYRPHCSLMYADTTIEVQKMAEIRTILRDARVGFKGTEQAEANLLRGWTGGTVWLVPTDNEISKWLPIATKKL